MPSIQNAKNYDEASGIYILHPEDELSQDYPKQKYRDQIMISLYGEDRTLHSALANRIDVSPSGLNAIIKKLNDVAVKPIREVKAGKFKFYLLSEAGCQYVETKILPLLIGQGWDGERIHSVFGLINYFKDRNRDTWCQKLETVLQEYNSHGANTDEQTDVIYEYLREVNSLYLKDKDKALKLVSLSVPNNDLCKKISAFFEEKLIGYRSEWEVLNIWVQTNRRLTYQVIDHLEETLIQKRDLADMWQIDLPENGQYMESILNRLQADMYQAMYKGWDKHRLTDYWIDSGIEESLSLYIADKYRSLQEYLIQNILRVKESAI